MTMEQMVRRFSVLLVFASAMWLASCGNPRPPEPPSLELPRAVRDLRATRKGEDVSLTWIKPERTTEGETILYLGPTRICRTLNSALKECGTPVGEIPPAAQGTSTPLKQSSKVSLSAHIAPAPTGTYTDTLPATPNASFGPNAEYTYAVEVLNQAQRSAGLSNQVRVPAVPTLEPPANFFTKATASGVLLSWAALPLQPPDTDALQHLIRIYRREQNSEKDLMIGALPISTTQFLDSSFEWGKTYIYHATVVSIIKTGPCSNGGKAAECKTEYVEGDDNPDVSLFAHDIFPPATPTGLQVVFGGFIDHPIMDLVWNPDTDADLAGYNIYRQEHSEGWSKINSELAKTPAYHDSTVEAGKTYTYSVSAVDLRGNQSAQSSSAHETVPAQP